MARFDDERSPALGSDALHKQVATLQKQLDKYRSIAAGSVGAVTKAFTMQGKAQTSLMKLQQRMTKDALTANAKIAKSYEKTTKQVIKLQKQLSKQVARGASGGSGGGFSLGSLLPALSLGGAAFAALRKFQSVGQAQIRGALALGPGVIEQIKKLGLPLSLKGSLGTLGGVAGLGPQQRYGLTPDAIKGLLGLQSSIRGVGEELSGELITELVRSFGADRSRFGQFVKMLNTGGAERALGLLSNPSQIEIADTIRNALAIQASDNPELTAIRSFVETTQALDKAFETLVLSISKELAPAMQQLAAYAETLPAKFEAAFQTLKGFGISPGVALGVGAGGAALLGLGARGGLPGLIAAGAAYDVWGAVQVYNESVGLAGDLSRLAAADQQTGGQVQQVKALIEKQLAAAKTTLDELKAKRAKIDARIYDLYKSNERGVFRQFFGADQYAPMTEMKANALRAARQKITDQIDALEKPIQEAAKTEQSPATSFFQTLKNQAIDAAVKGFDFARETFEQLKTAIANGRAELARQRAARSAELDLTASERASLTGVRRAELELAKMNPYGQILAAPETRRLQEQIRDEIKSLNDKLANIDESTKEGKIQANQIREQVLRLRIEEKAAAQSLIQAYLDSEISKVFGSIGRFEKIILERDLNARIGLEKGILRRDLPEVTGSLKPSGRLPRSALEVAGSVMPNVPTLTKGDKEQIDRLDILVRQNQQLLRILPTVAAEPQNEPRRKRRRMGGSGATDNDKDPAPKLLQAAKLLGEAAQGMPLIDDKPVSTRLQSGGPIFIP